MDIVLDDAEVRILGCLIEKEMTTPEYYPLSLNALTNACNQKSNRNPVVSFDETGVAHKLDSLQGKSLLRKTQAAGSRVTKYLHTILDLFDLSRQEMAVLCELMLRGPQTAGEIRSRTERMSVLGDLEEAEKTLRTLIDQDPPLALKLPRQAGRKECRYTHLFSRVPSAVNETYDRPLAPAAQQVPTHEKITRLEEEIAELRTELGELKQAFAEFKSQF